MTSTKSYRRPKVKRVATLQREYSYKWIDSLGDLLHSKHRTIRIKTNAIKATDEPHLRRLCTRKLSQVVSEV